MIINTLLLHAYPMYVELDINETADIEVAGKTRQIALSSITHSYEPDFWITDNPARQTIRQAEVMLRIDGNPVALVQRPYELPVEYKGLRLYVENTHEWATACNLAALPDLKKAVRLSIMPEDQGWGPKHLRFPIADYRWRSASYQNTWSSLVPYNLHYYHRGDDFGAIPDQLDVLAMMDGEITMSPVPSAADSNSLVIQGDNGLRVLYAHMNIETIDPELTTGARVKAGQVLGKTGCTWNGWRSQHNDPHLHIGLSFNGIQVSSYPYLVEAYLRDYPDAALAAAGGYQFTTVGNQVKLDATRSVPRSGERIIDYTWRLHDGREVHRAVVELRIDTPGQYAESLTITTASGFVTSDVAHIRVYNPTQDQKIGYGWLYAFPVRHIKPGNPINFWNRLVNTSGTAIIDLGDGSPSRQIDEELNHIYTQSGLYVVTLTSKDRYDNPVQAKIPVHVEKP